MQQPSINSRIRLNGYPGTIRFVGEVRGTRGTWLGVEWDDPSRGKHNGEKDGIRYFSCLKEKSGSFIRPSAPGINFGQSFLAALSSKYIENLQGVTESVILGSSNGAIKVEAANLDLIRSNLARLETLKEVSLDDVASAEPPGIIRKKCPSIQGLDLSDSLLSDWDTIALITSELIALERLFLNRTRIQLPRNRESFAASFHRLSELQISSTAIQWPEFLYLLHTMPTVTSVELGLNNLTHLSATDELRDRTYNIESLNLDSNLLSNWSEICYALKNFTRLRRLLLTANRLERITPHQAEGPRAQLEIEQLLLTDNHLSVWSDIDNITLWAPKLSKLRLRGNPLYEDPKEGKYHRQLLVAKIPTLTELDGSTVNSKERRDCEIFYTSHVARSEYPTEAERDQNHPRWKDLCEKWGASEEAPKIQKESNTLGSQLIGVKVHRCTSPPTGDIPTVDGSITLRVLKTMTVKILRLKIAKSFKLSRVGQGDLKLWLPMNDRKFAELTLAQDDNNLTWWGFEDGTDVYMYFDD